ncbi:tyrosine-type recombinase/integrase [Gymnodinialimonas ceratoperidinii]|uniref:Tyrosine-type recombinase/integrase n=1 Tax=Gymnodinialimonas ceratoperidinii TaxID=2856823 RepID=A0A8F6TW22_9RHOB|nr:site-specific integrase [Gymnodinialimonas ceratoperidinii]QXT38746.1 tyrosine-type recombinase/integrase [Gymnodinialimonas ceratoperidinii]
MPDDTHDSVYTGSTCRPERAPLKITQAVLNGLVPPASGYKLAQDTYLPGFGVRITSKGAISFILNYRASGRLRRFTIGRYPDWTVNAARKRSQELRRMIDVGIDPMAEKQDARQAPIIRDLFDRYCRDHLPKKRPSSQQTDRQMWENFILPVLGALKVADLTFDHCDALHRKISAKTPIQANRVIGLLRKSCNLAIRWRWIDQNPAQGIALNPENKRERYLTPSEIGQLNDAMEKHPEQTSCDIIRFLILTGCRSGEAFRARWDQFDPEYRVWTKPAATTKQKKLHRVPVSGTVAQLLTHRRAQSDSEWVFPSHTGKPFVTIRRTWFSLCEEIGLEDVRMHDLRHTFASLLASQGTSLPIIGAMLGHTQPNTTARYAHLFDDTLAAAAERVASSVR